MVLVAVVVLPLGVHAAQNIFFGLNKVTDIWYGGKKVNKVVYRGEVLWERAPTSLPYAGLMQNITAANCPTNLSRANDARDNASYLVRKQADGRCWMLTNLAYGGGGTNTYNDVKTITLNSTNTGMTLTIAQYYIPTGANRTVGTTDPSTSTDGGATNPQYGYLYNWCAAMGRQTGTSACSTNATPLADMNVSICPSGWRLPTGGTGGEYQQLTDAVGATVNGAAGSAALRYSWLGMYSGVWGNGLSGQGNGGYYWSSSQYGGTSVWYMTFSSSNVNAVIATNKGYGYAVRCITL